MISETSTAIVIDNGSGIIKGGLSGDEAPRSSFPNLVGKPKNQAIIVGGDNKECYFGRQAIQKKGVLSISCPMEHGIVKDWEDMIKVWHHAFYSELLVECAEQPIMITETPNTTEAEQRKMTEVLFEFFNAPAVFFMPTNVLALFSTGKTTGLVLDTGHDVTNALPIFEGYAINENLETENYGGKAISDALRVLYESHNPLIKGNFNCINELKEGYASVATFGETEMNSKYKEEMYTLPDGQKIRLGNELVSIPEQIFKPLEGGFTKRSVQRLIKTAIDNCDEGLRREFYENILVTGGNSLLEGYTERLNHELSQLTDNQSILEVRKERIYASWIGASLISSMSTFHQLCITRDDYMRDGAEIVRRKCLL